MMLLFSSLSGQSGKMALKNQPHFKHMPGLEAMQHTHQAEGCLAKFGRAVGDEGANPVPHLHHPHGCQVAYASAKAGTADLQRARKFAFGRDFVSQLQCAILNEGANMVDHLHGPMRIRNFLFHPWHKGWHLLALPEMQGHNEINTEDLPSYGEIYLHSMFAF